MSTNKTYFAFKGQIGFYTSKQEAIKQGGSVTNVIELTSQNTRLALVTALKEVARTRFDVDFKALAPYVSERDICLLRKLKRNTTYTTAYINRNIDSKGNSVYGIWFSCNKFNYCFKSPISINREQITDEVIILKLEEITKRLGFEGTLKTPIPLHKDFYKHLKEWDVLEIPCYGYDLQMLSLIEVLKGNESIIPVITIK